MLDNKKEALKNRLLNKHFNFIINSSQIKSQFMPDAKLFKNIGELCYGKK